MADPVVDSELFIPRCKALFESLEVRSVRGPWLLGGERYGWRRRALDLRRASVPTCCLLAGEERGTVGRSRRAVCATWHAVRGVGVFEINIFADLAVWL